MFITIVIVNLCKFFSANRDSYEKSWQLKSNKKNFRREIHENKNLFIKIIYNNQLKY